MAAAAAEMKVTDSVRLPCNAFNSLMLVKMKMKIVAMVILANV